MATPASPRTADSAERQARLAERVRTALAGQPRVVDKKMFGGTMFMVNGAMCVSAGKDRLMCRVDPAVHDSLLGPGVTTVVMGGRQYRGYVHVSADTVRTKKNFDRWIALALAQNAKLKPAVRKTRTTTRKR